MLRQRRLLLLLLRWLTITSCLLLLLVSMHFCCCSAGDVSGGVPVTAGRQSFLAAVLSLCPPPLTSLTGSGGSSVGNLARLRRSVVELRRQSQRTEAEAVYNNLTDIARACRASGDATLSEPLTAELLRDLADGRLRVPRCQHLPVASTLAQFPGCDRLLLMATDGGNVCGCVDSLLAKVDELNDVLNNFDALLSQIYFASTASVNARSRHGRSMRKCLDVYKDWLCSVKFEFYKDPSDPATLVKPCPEWCQAVETECPYLTPSEDFSNSGEPVFLCHEDSYKGTGRSDRCTTSTSNCCCYQPPANHSNSGGTSSSTSLINSVTLPSACDNWPSATNANSTTFTNSTTASSIPSSSSSDSANSAGAPGLP